MIKITKILLIISAILGAIAIVPIIINIFAIKHINEAKKAEDISMLWKILVLLLGGPLGLIAGILMFLVKDEHFAEA